MTNADASTLIEVYLISLVPAAMLVGLVLWVGRLWDERKLRHERERIEL